MMPAWVTPEPFASELVPESDCGEHRLWRAVLLQVLADAEAWRAQRFTAKNPRIHALDGFLMIRDASRDFRRLCDLAAIDADALRRAFFASKKLG